MTNSKQEHVSENSSEENNLLRDSAVAFCTRDAGITRLRTLKRSESDFDPSVWHKMVELGWSAILVEDASDGLGLGLDAAAIIAEELGRVVAPEPFIEVAGLAVMLLNKLPPGAQRQMLLRSIASGDLMPIVCASEVQANALEDLPRATANSDGFSLTGHVDHVVHASDADGFLVPASLDGGLALFWALRSTPAITVESRKLADNTSHARVSFANTALDKSCLLGGGATVSAAFNSALSDAQVLTSAYLCGLMTQTLETTLDYLRMRKQFGRAIGSFQVLQHRAVDLYIARELASSVVTDVVGSMMRETDEAARAILASRARYRTTEAALAVTRAAIQMHGAIGFTDECDIGHYLNRAMVLGSRRGNASWHLRQLAVLALDDERSPVQDTSALASTDGSGSTRYNDLSDEEFRYLVRTWFEKEYPEELRYPPRRLHFEEIKDWYLKLSEKSWLAPSWPVEFGGMGLSPAKMLIFIEEQERWGVARAPDMGITMIGPLLIQHGNAQQREQYLPKILAGENIWCQGYSEPNAGSDLASLQCDAVLDGDEFVVNGQKTWTTLAQDATHIFLLVRTDKHAKKQAGISFLLVDISSPGITIRPIRNIAGDEEFCEVFFDDVSVPTENLVGEMNTGWAIAKALLGFERIFLGSPKQSQYALQRLESIIAGQDLMNDRGFMDRFARLKVDTLDLEVIYTRFAQIVRDGGTLGPEVSILKIWATETFARLSELMLEAAGELGAERGELKFGNGKANILSQFYNARPATIYGGSNEIQRNIVAKNVLELPDS
ncbi:MAG: alkylation response protein AidB-like acyl-CoA dehydrogenase [Gammaproteobacteria bacterium]|jgi:alkylation response protein AidB-like acyl-CoA dehydrogenase